MLKIVDSEQLVDFTPTEQKFIFKSASEFSQYIITQATQDGMDCMNVLIAFCEERDIEIEDAMKYVDRALRDRIASELIAGGYAPRGTTSDVGQFFEDDSN